MTDHTPDLAAAYDRAHAALNAASDELSVYCHTLTDRLVEERRAPTVAERATYATVDGEYQRARTAFLAATAARANAVRKAAGVTGHRCHGCACMIAPGAHVPWDEDCRAAARERALSITADPD